VILATNKTAILVAKNSTIRIMVQVLPQRLETGSHTASEMGHRMTFKYDLFMAVSSHRCVK
jgi:hypothetical protein